MSINVKLRIKRNEKRSRSIFKVVVLVALCFVCFVFSVSYIRYQQCLSENRRLQSIYADLLVKIKEIEKNNDIIKGVNNTK